MEMVTIRGVQVPAEIRSLKQRIREELQIATSSRRLRLDEEEEIRRMEADMAERERVRRFRRIEAEKESAAAEEESARRRMREADTRNRRKEDDEISRLQGRMESFERGKPSSGTCTWVPDQRILRPAARLHRRQNSDPTVTGRRPFSPPPPPARRTRRYTAGLSHPTAFDETLKRYYDSGAKEASSTLTSSFFGRRRHAPRLSASQSESCLPVTSQSGTPTYYHSDDDEVKNKEEKRLLLQMEIGLRKRRLEQTRMLQQEIRRLVEMPDVSAFEMEEARHRYQQHLRARDPDAPGVIRSIDYQIRVDHPQRTATTKCDVRKTTYTLPVRQSWVGDVTDYLTHRPNRPELKLTKKILPDCVRLPGNSLIVNS